MSDRVKFEMEFPIKASQKRENKRNNKKVENLKIPKYFF